ncbi:uncharacterized protein LOC143211766 [Lasioglossum baleicum]|uniref:uncharacterized protein LOC143211766 n=1 Tax=Lasioglossum baleicum TaxID=434251 RepID=UPI003FCE7381
MLKVSIYAGIWVLTILLSVVSASITTKNNIVSSINNSWHYHHDYRCRRNTGQLGNATYHTLSFKYILQDFKHSPNETGTLDSSSITASLKNRNADYSTNGLIESPHNTTKLFVASNDTLPEFRKAHRHPDYLWKRRTLCSLSDQGQSPHRRTLSDYNDPVLINDFEDPDSLKTLVRVKRAETNLDSPSAYQQNYFKDLADSFPQSSYDYVGENDDGDVSIDAKRETNLLEYFADDRPVELNSREAEKNLNAELSSRGNDESDRDQLSGEKKPFSAEKVADDKETNAGFAVPTEDRASSKESIETVNQQNSGAVLKDPTELVRRKRNNRERAERKRRLETQDSAKTNEENFSGDEAEKPLTEKKQPASSDKLEESDAQCRKLSSLAIADLKANLLRIKRKAKNERREKSFKSKKKKKHASKKHNDPKGNPRRSRKNVRSKNTQRPRSVRKGKNSEARVDGKSHVGFAKLVSKTNNQNNFRRRSVSPIKPFDIVSENDRMSLRDDTLKNDVVENNINADNSALSLAEHGGSVQTRQGSESLNALMQRVEQDIQDGDPITSETKVRSKRDKSAESRHGFLSDEDELQYYENIREFEPDTDCAVQDDSPGNNEEEVGRAARSIEEVKDLAKKLVTKVDELENYLNIGEAKTDDKEEEKRIEIRAIDDLCSNVTATCAEFKEPSEIVQRCVPTSTEKIVIDRKIRPKDADDRVKEKNKNSAVKKRSSHENNAKMLPSTKNNRRDTDKSQRKWGRWTDWSSCSVTCGKGRQIRWRYCLHDCNNAETEMEEKACQLPACPPGKFLGIF